MTKDAPAFDFYPERWLAGVADLSDGEQIAYLRLLCHQWLREGLPADEVSLGRLAGRKISKAVLNKFPVQEDGNRRNNRLETIRKEQRERIAKASEKARKMAERRWGKRDADASTEQCSSNATALLEQCPPPTTHHSTKGDKSPLAGEELFETGGGDKPPTAKPKRPANTDPRFVPFRDAFVKAYENHTGTAYHFKVQDGVQLASLLKAIPQDRLSVEMWVEGIARCRKRGEDQFAPGWIKTAPGSLATFASQWAKLVELSAQQKQQPAPVGQGGGFLAGTGFEQR